VEKRGLGEEAARVAYVQGRSGKRTKRPVKRGVHRQGRRAAKTENGSQRPRLSTISSGHAMRHDAILSNTKKPPRMPISWSVRAASLPVWLR